MQEFAGEPPVFQKKTGAEAPAEKSCEKRKLKDLVVVELFESCVTVF